MILKEGRVVRDDSGNKIRTIIQKYGILLALIGFSILISIITPRFLSMTNILNIFRQSSIVGIMAIGSTFVIIAGGFDISVGSMLALTAAMVVGFQKFMPWPVSIFLVLIIGAGLGVFNGFLTAKINIPSLIATLGMMSILRGAVYLYTGGYPVYTSSESFSFIGSGYVLGVPLPVIILIILVILGQFVLKKTRFGRYVHALGGNKEAARLSGVKVDFYLIMAFAVGGLMAASSGIIYASRLLSVTPLAGAGYELDAIASTVIGGTSVSGGEGTVWGTLVGVLFLTIITNVFNLLGVNVYVQYLIKGVIILLAVGFDSYSKKQSK